MADELKIISAMLKKQFPIEYENAKIAVEEQERQEAVVEEPQA